MTGPAIILPTVGGDNGTWGTELNAAVQQINDYDNFVYKTADESVTSNTTLQDDDHLVNIPLAVGTHIVEAMLMASGAAAGDVKVAWAFSGTATGYRAGQGPSFASTDALGATAQAVRSSASSGASAPITASTPYGTDGTNWSYILERGLLIVTVTGTLKVQWAQNTSNAAATVMRAGSWVWTRRVL